MPQIDNLDIQIKATAGKAAQNIDTLVQKLGDLNNALSSASGSGSSLASLAGSVSQLADAMLKMKGVTLPDFNRLGKGLDRLAQVNPGSISATSSAVGEIGRALQGIGGQTISEGATNIKNVGDAVKIFGYKATERAIANIPYLTDELNEMMTTLSSAPQVSDNLIQMVNALGNLSKNIKGSGQDVKKLGEALQNDYVRGVKSAKRATSNLIDRLNALFTFINYLRTIVRFLGKTFEKSIGYIETFNYFSQVYESLGDASKKQSGLAGEESAEEFVKSYAERTAELTERMSGFSLDTVTGALTESTGANLGISPTQLLQYQTTFTQLASSFGTTTDQAVKLSNTLTMIGADLASVRNLDFKDVWDDMASGISGQTKVWRKYGVDISETAMNAKLAALGVSETADKLTQADKAILRTIILLDSSKYAFGDLAETINQPANQIRLLKSNWESLIRVIGQLFMPLISKVLPVINGIVVAIRRLFTWLGALLGISFSASGDGSTGGSSVGDLADDASDLGSSLDDANGSAKALKKTLLGFDQINALNDKDSGSGGKGASVGGGAGGILDDAFNLEVSQYEAEWQKALDGLENKFEETADNIAKAWEPVRVAFEQLWNNGLSKLADFTWGALGDFYNDFLKPLGDWTLGTGLPTLIGYIDDFLNDIDWDKLRTNLDNFWKAVEPFVEGFGEGLLDFFKGVLEVSADIINGIADAIGAFADALGLLSEEDKKSGGEVLGQAVGALISIKALVGIPKVLEGINTALHGKEGLEESAKKAAEAVGEKGKSTGLIGAIEALGAETLIVGGVGILAVAAMVKEYGEHADEWRASNEETWANVKKEWAEGSKNLKKSVDDMNKNVQKATEKGIVSWGVTVGDATRESIQKAEKFSQDNGSIWEHMWQTLFNTADKESELLGTNISADMSEWKDQFSYGMGDIETTVTETADRTVTEASNLFGVELHAPTIADLDVTNLNRQAQNAVSGVARMFGGTTLRFPGIPLPHFSVTPAGWTIGDLLKGSIPHLSVNWYAQGGVFDHPSVIGVGEAGREAVMPLEHNTGWISELAEQIGTHIAMNTNGNGMSPTLYVEVKTEDNEVLARAVTKGQQSIDYRSNPTPKFSY